jgi:crotonobetainyl-CoA:carnitine CoA-transferase CaiB-like acyl-CoA transferase
MTHDIHAQEQQIATTRPLPLAGIRILSLEQYGAGPFGTSHLADLGAEVIKIEDPRAGGDVGRYVPPFTQGEDSLFFEGLNRGKKSISLDISAPAGRALFEELVKVSDAVYSNMRGDVPGKIKITYDDLKSLNPAIVCCSLSGFGTTGPRAAEPGYDYIVQGLTGWMDVTGEPDGPPTKSGLSVVDWSTGYVAALALLAGLRAAERDGIGMDCDVSLYDTAVSMLSYPGVWHLNAGYEPQRTRHSAHPSIVPFQAFRAADGWFVIGAAKEKFWVRAATVLGMPELAADPRFATMTDRQVNAAELLEIIEPVVAAKPVDHWVTALRAAGVPAGEVKSVAEALQDPQVRARGLVVQADHPVYGRVKTLASPVRVGGEFAVPTRAPRRGEHTDSILAGLLHMDQAEIDQACREGAFGLCPGQPATSSGQQR